MALGSCFTAEAQQLEGAALQANRCEDLGKQLYLESGAAITECRDGKGSGPLVLHSSFVVVVFHVYGTTRRIKHTGGQCLSIQYERPMVW